MWRVFCSINGLASLERYTAKPWNALSKLMCQLRVPLDHDKVMMDEELNKDDLPAPQLPPDALLPFYTRNGLATVDYSKYLSQTYWEGDALNPVWTKEPVETWIQDVNLTFTVHRHVVGWCGADSSNFVKLLKELIPLNGKRVLVNGTEHPWLENVFAFVGATKVVTLEFAKNHQ